jgi:hypothetical protein
LNPPFKYNIFILLYHTLGYVINIR